MTSKGSTWQSAKSSRGPSKSGATVELAPPARAVAVVQFGGLPQIDIQARNMSTFIATNYGAPGAKAKKFKTDSGDIELRRAVASSGNGPLDIVSDIKSAARALRKDKATTKVVVLVLHGNDEGLSRIYRNGYLEDMLTGDQLRSVGLYESELGRLKKELARYEGNLAAANAKHDTEAADEAKFRVDDTRGLIRKWENDPNNADAAGLLAVLRGAADALEEANVDALELQACNVGAIEGLATFSFAGRLERLLSTPTHGITIRTHRRYVSSGVHSKNKKVMVFLGADPKATDNNELSSTTLPPFVDP